MPLIVEPAAAGEAAMVIARNENVVQYAHPEEFAGAYEPFRHQVILAARLRVSARMVVYEHDGGRRFAQRRREDFARVNEALREAASADFDLADQPMARIQQHNGENLLAVASHPGPKVPRDLLGRVETSAPAQRLTR